ncbi:hypothetical protein ACRRTK_008705 [Alexandromys fortis]
MRDCREQARGSALGLTTSDQKPRRQECVGPRRTGVIDGCELLCGYKEQNHGPASALKVWSKLALILPLPPSHPLQYLLTRIAAMTESVFFSVWVSCIPGSPGTRCR